MRTIVSTLFFLSLLFLGVNCLWMRDRNGENPLNQITNGWVDLNETYARRVYRFYNLDSPIEVIVYRMNRNDVVGNLYHDSPKRLEEWQAMHQLDLVINAGFFNEHNEPTGLLVIDGNRIGLSEYDLDRSGTILFSEGVEILDTNTTPIPPYEGLPYDLLQSFPLLIADGQPLILEDSNLQERRTVLAVNEKYLYVIVVDQTPVSLYQLMRMLLNSDLDIDMALNLDGGSSTGLSAEIGTYQERLTPLAPLPQVIGFTKRLPRSPNVQ